MSACNPCRRRNLLRPELPTIAVAIVCWSLVHGLASLLVTGQLPGDPRALAPLAAEGLAEIFFYGALDQASRRAG
jgi:hypothetical protein